MEHFQPTHLQAYRAGVPDASGQGHRDFYVEVKPSFGAMAVGECYMVSVIRGNSGSSIQPEIRDWRAACALADHLYAVLAPEQAAHEAANERRNREWHAEQQAKEPARREAAAKAERERLAAARTAPKVRAAVCPECDELAEDEDYCEPTYECGTCGTTGRGEEGRRCEQCHKFTAKATHWSCPSCEVGLEETPELVAARKLPDGKLVAESELANG